MLGIHWALSSSGTGLHDKKPNGLGPSNHDANGDAVGGGCWRSDQPVAVGFVGCDDLAIVVQR